MKVRYIKRMGWTIAILTLGIIIHVVRGHILPENDIMSRASISEIAMLSPDCTKAGLSSADIQAQQARVKQFVDIANGLGVFDVDECDDECLDCLLEIVKAAIQNSRNSP